MKLRRWHTDYLIGKARKLVDDEDAIARNMTTAVADLHGFSFGDEGEDGGAGAAGMPQQATLVDDVNVNHEPGSLPYMLDQIKPHLPAPTERLSAAEQFIYDEMMRNVNCDQVKSIKHLLSIAEPILVGHDDYGDQITMRAGIDLFKRYGPNMTAQQFHAGLFDVINQMDAAQRAGKDVPQIRHVPG